MAGVTRDTHDCEFCEKQREGEVRGQPVDPISWETNRMVSPRPQVTAAGEGGLEEAPDKTRARRRVMFRHLAYIVFGLFLLT